MISLGRSNEKESDSPKAPQVWVERDRVVSSSYRAAKAQNKQLESKGQEQLSKQLAAERELLESMDDELQKHFAGELRMFRVRLEAMDLCFHQKDADKVKQFIGRFTAVNAADKDEALPSGPMQMGSCPPCELYAKLRPVSDLDAVAEKFQNAMCPKHIKDCVDLLLSAVRGGSVMSC